MQLFEALVVTGRAAADSLVITQVPVSQSAGPRPWRGSGQKNEANTFLIREFPRRQTLFVETFF